MWPFKRSRRDMTHQQAGSAEPARPRVRGRWRLVALVSLALLIVALLGVFWAELVTVDRPCETRGFEVDVVAWLAE